MTISKKLFLTIATLATTVFSSKLNASPYKNTIATVYVLPFLSPTGGAFVYAANNLLTANKLAKITKGLENEESLTKQSLKKMVRSLKIRGYLGMAIGATASTYLLYIGYKHDEKIEQVLSQKQRNLAPEENDEEAV